MGNLIIRIILAALIGFIIGKISNKSATARTFALVCTGAALITIISSEYFKVAGYPWISDPGRLTAQVVSALGFIGTGLIWISEDAKVEGLSVSASLWFTAILGIIIGAGLYSITAGAIIVLVCVYWLTNIIIKWKNNTNI